MATLISSSLPVTPPPGWCQRLLRWAGVEAWFRRTPAGPHAGREERAFLLLTLTNAPVRSPEPLAAALASCCATIEAGGGEVAQQQVNRVLLSWPADNPAGLLTAYQHLRACLGQQVGHEPLLYGAATLGWVTRRGAGRYRGEVLTQVAGILHEARRVGSPLLLAAALHHCLGNSADLRSELHVAFRVPGHRYPATLYRIAP